MPAGSAWRSGTCTSAMSLSTADSLARGRRPEASGLGGGFGQTPQDSALPPLFLGPLLQGNLLLVGAQLSWQELQPRCLCKDQPTLPSSRGKAAVPSPGGSWPWSASVRPVRLCVPSRGCSYHSLSHGSASRGRAQPAGLPGCSRQHQALGEACLAGGRCGEHSSRAT